MWKIFFEYSDKSKVTITGKSKEISLELAEKYNNQYKNAESAIYQQYPKKDNVPVELHAKIEELRKMKI